MTRMASPAGAILLLAFASLFVGAHLVRTLSGTELTFEWDEWTILWSMSAGPSWLLQNHIGHFFPLGRAFYWLQTQTFELNYYGYVGVNFTLLLAITSLLFWLLSRLTGRALLSAMLAALYLLAHGHYYNVIWALQSVWFIAMLFTVLLLLRITRLTIPIGDPINLVLIGLVWLSFSSALIIVPGVVLVCRAVMRARNGESVLRNEVVAAALLLVLVLELMVLGRMVIQDRPPLHIGGRGPAIDLTERLSRSPLWLGEGATGLLFYSTAPLVPGALRIPGGRDMWSNASAWITERPRLSIVTFGSLTMLVALAVVRVVRRPPSGGSFSAWATGASAALAPPILLTALARSGYFGPPFVPRYDTWLLVGSAVAMAALIFRRDDGMAPDRPAKPGTGRLLPAMCAVAVTLNVCWLAAKLPSNLPMWSIPRDKSARGWAPLIQECRTPTGQHLVVPKTLQPELTLEQLCWIVRYLEER